MASGVDGGDHSPGPTSFMFAGQSLRGYSNGSAVISSVSGGAVYISLMCANGGAPTVARSAFNPGKNFWSGPIAIGCNKRSRRRPNGPRARGNPGPNGGASRDGYGIGNGCHVAHGMPLADA